MYLDKIVSLFAVLIIIGISVYLFLDIKDKMTIKDTQINNGMVQDKYPECPDFFDIINENGEKKCKNVYNLGSCINTEGNNKISAFFNHDFFKDPKKGNYRRCLWSKDCEVPWEGIDRLC